MTQVFQKINELKELLKESTTKNTTMVAITFTPDKWEINITEQSPEELRKKGVYSRNLKGETIG